MKRPHFDLAEVQQLVGSNKVRFSVSKARGPLTEHYGAAQWRRHGMRILSALSLGSYHGTIEQNGSRFDAYALRVDDVGWYVKVAVDNVLSARGDVEEQLFTISCHPLEAPIRTNDSEVEP